MKTNVKFLDSGKEIRFNMWLKKLDTWRKRYKLTRGIACKILYENDENDWHSLMEWAEIHDFLEAVIFRS